MRYFIFYLYQMNICTCENIYFDTVTVDNKTPNILMRQFGYLKIDLNEIKVV